MLNRKNTLALSLATLTLAACSGTNPAAPLTATNTAPPPTPTPSPTVPTITPTPGCTERHGAIEAFDLESEYLDAGLQFRVYTPPCYAAEPESSYPVLYLIHGQSFNDDQWERLGAGEAADQLIASGEVAPFLIVMPYDRSSAEPSVDPFDEAVIEELLPWVEEHYLTLSGRDFRAVGGLSRGASWAFHFGILYPDLFSAMGGHSPPVFVEEAGHVRAWLAEIPAGHMPRIWLDIGDRDRPEILESAQWFAGVLDELDIAHEWYLFSGYHDEAYWSSHMETYLRWYAQDW